MCCAEFLNQLVTAAFLPPKHTSSATAITTAGPPVTAVPTARRSNAEPTALFLETVEHKLYPNPARRDAQFSEWYEFLGMVLGKALYENQLVELPLAPFFLSKLLGKSNSLADLASLDAELHRNLVYVMGYRGDFAEVSDV